MTKVHSLAPNHKRSHHNPGEADPGIADAALAYRTTRCGQTYYCKRVGLGWWIGQVGTTTYASEFAEDVSCVSCQRILWHKS